MLREIRLSRAQGQLTDTAIRQFILLIDRASLRLRYRDEQDREDCKQGALEDCLRYWQNFDEGHSDKPNPFSFFTQVAKNGMAKTWKKLHHPDMPTVSLTLLNNLDGPCSDDE